MDTMKAGVDEQDEEYAISSIKLTKDLKVAAQNLDERQVRYFVDRYYQLQADRVRADAQAREEATPSALLNFTRDHAWRLETVIKTSMKHYALSRPVGVWLMGVHGIGPVLAAGLLSHLDVTKAKSAASFWRFAGMDPTVAWEGKAAVRAFVDAQVAQADTLEEAVAQCARLKGRNAASLLHQATTKPDGTPKKLTVESITKALSRQPWNAQLKVLCWKAGESFVKHSGNEKCLYGQLYRKRKALEVSRNQAGEHGEAAAQILTQKTFKADTVAKAAYSAGRFPDGHVDMRAKRAIKKLFLAHVFQVMFEAQYHRPAPIPYVFAFADHDFSHYLQAPGWVSPPKPEE